MPLRSPEHPKVLLTRTLAGFEPATAYDAERLAAYGIGNVIEATLWQRRSIAHHRLYWVVLSICVANSEGKYGSAEDLHSAIKIALGYTHRIQLLIPSEHSMIATRVRKVLRECWRVIKSTGAAAWLHLLKDIEAGNVALSKLETDKTTVVLPGSIAFDRIDQSEFRTFFDSAMEQLRLARYPVDQIIEEAKKQLHRIKTVKTKQQSSLPQRETEHVRQQEAAG
jgi:uncharacterized protein DUF1367